MKRRITFFAFMLMLVCFCYFSIVTVYAKENIKEDGWYYYMGWEGGKVSNYIYRKGNSIFIRGTLRKTRWEFDYPGKILSGNRWSFKLSANVEVYTFPDGKKEMEDWKTLKEWGWYKKKHYSPGVYFKVRNGKVVYMGIHS